MKIVDDLPERTTPMSVRDVMPDWQQIWTVAQAEKELINFKFRGPGIYPSPPTATVDTLLNGKGRTVGAGDTMIVAPADQQAMSESYHWEGWHQSGWKPEQLFCFLVYNGRSPALALSALSHAPVRE